MSKPYQDPSAEISASEKKINAKRSQKTQVLIVDSNPAMSRILSRLLTKAKVSFAIAFSGQDAVKFCSDTSFELILMEVNMLGMDGLEAAKKIRNLSDLYKKIPIIAVSAKTTENDIKIYEKNGLHDFLKKPINEINLMELLQKHLKTFIVSTANKPPEDDEIYAILDEDEMSLVNWDTLKEYSLVLKKEYPVMMRDFLKASPDLIGNLGEAIISGEGNQVQSLAHQLKSTSLIFGVEGVSNIAAKLEILGRTNDLEHAGQFFKELHMSFEKVQPVLRKKLALMRGMH